MHHRNLRAIKLVPSFLAASLLVLATLAGCDGTTVDPSSSSSSSSSGGSGGPCSTTDPCADGICIYAAGTCDPSSIGVCQNFFQCDGPATGPICDCNGKTIEGEYPGCGMEGPYDNAAACQTGTFACGPMLMCKRNSDICVVTNPGAAGPSTYECRALANVENYCLGGIPACNCVNVNAIGAGATCQEDADFQDTVTLNLP